MIIPNFVKRIWILIHIINNLRATAEAGQMLLDSGHYASEEVKEKLTLLSEEKTDLLFHSLYCVEANEKLLYFC